VLTEVTVLGRQEEDVSWWAVAGHYARVTPSCSA
jgi:hypothetical protein